MEETVVKWSLSQGAIWTFRVVEGRVLLDEKPRNKRTSENGVLWVPREFATYEFLLFLLLKSLEIRHFNLFHVPLGSLFLSDIEEQKRVPHSSRAWLGGSWEHVLSAIRKLDITVKTTGRLCSHRRPGLNAETAYPVPEGL